MTLLFILLGFHIGRGGLEGGEEGVRGQEEGGGGGGGGGHQELRGGGGQAVLQHQAPVHPSAAEVTGLLSGNSRIQMSQVSGENYPALQT